MSRSKGKKIKIKIDRQQTPQAPKNQTPHFSASQSASPPSPRSQKRKKAKAAAAAAASLAAKAVKPLSKKVPPPAPKIPSYKIKFQALKEPITSVVMYYGIYSLTDLWTEMTGQSILVQTSGSASTHFTPQGANVMAYLLNVLEHEDGWDKRSIGKLGKFPLIVAESSLDSMRQRTYMSRSFMNQAPVETWRFKWLVEYAKHLAKNPPPNSRVSDIDEDISAINPQDFSPESAEMKKILILGGSRPNEQTGTLALILVHKYGITLGVLDQLSDPDPKNKGRRILQDEMVLYNLAAAMAERRLKKKNDIGIEKVSISMNIVACLVKGWTKC